MLYYMHVAMSNNATCCQHASSHLPCRMRPAPWYCAGIQAFLTDPNDTTIVFTAHVSTDGTSFTTCTVTRWGDMVYV